jgi:SHS2 domain-containing protein
MLHAEIRIFMIYTNKTSKYKEIDHTADVGISVTGNTLPELYSNLAFGMLDIMTTSTRKTGIIHRSVQLAESSLPDLVVSWLSEINYLFHVHHFLMDIIESITIEESQDMIQLSALLTGKEITNLASCLKTEIKAVTYHQLKCEKENDHYISRVIFDI